ncbi:hypothetical protein [Paenibacillus sp. FSL R7-0179]|uniref:hypothetical protein n=1 Tax=Paenibacillus sp. FSL R7-0179 TaxID=2921672 RepID=UPI0030F88A55
MTRAASMWGGSCSLRCDWTLTIFIEIFPFSRPRPNEYDIIVAVSSLEHVGSAQVLEQKLSEMNAGTRAGGAIRIIIASNIREILLENKQELDPMFEVNLSTEKMIELLNQQFAGWEIEKLIVKSLAFEINRNGQPVKLTSDCITFVSKKS